jgi:hypothetical protein
MRFSRRRALAIAVSAALAASLAGIQLSDKTVVAADPSRALQKSTGSVTPTPTMGTSGASPAATAKTRASTTAAKRATRKPAARASRSARRVIPKPSKPQHPSRGKALLGMSAPLNMWNQRVREVGPGLQARRLFFTSFDASLSKATEACNAGMYPVMSFKTGRYSWAQVAAGSADASLRALASRLAALPCGVFVAIHHEPATDGPAADWAKMQVHALPILGGPAGGNIKVGVIGNGWWFSPTNHGLSDSEIAAYITPGVKRVSDVIASDTYQMTSTGEEAAPKIKGMAAWARRTGGVKALGIGEFNAATASAITNAVKALAADPLYAWGCLWNADLNTVTALSGARLAAFRAALANW